MRARTLSILAGMLLAAALTAPGPRAQALFASGLDRPTSILQLQDGRVLVAEPFADRVRTFTPEGVELDPFVTDILYPFGLLQLDDGRVLVDVNGRTLAAFDPDGTPLPDFAVELNGAYALTQLADGRVLVAEQTGGLVLAFGPDGTGPTRFASGFSIGAFGIAQLQDSRVLVSDFYSVMEFNADGSGRKDFAVDPGSVFGILQLNDGRILCANGVDVLVFDPDGTERGTFGSGFSFPNRIVQLADGRVLITDYEAGTVRAFEVEPVAAEANGDAPDGLALRPAYPNPFSGSTTVVVETARAEHLRVVVSDLLGREVATLMDGPVAAGRQEVVLAADALPNGTYIVHAHAAGASARRRVTVMR